MPQVPVPMTQKTPSASFQMMSRQILNKRVRRYLSGNVCHEIVTANETENTDAIVLVQDTQCAQHLA